MLKKNKLRYNEYYDMQHIYDELYAQSKNGNNFYKLLEIIGSEQNICLAYRNLKSNSGSKTAGTDGTGFRWRAVSPGGASCRWA